jgi:hypothetical protein
MIQCRGLGGYPELPSHQSSNPRGEPNPGQRCRYQPFGAPALIRLRARGMGSGGAAATHFRHTHRHSTAAIAIKAQ